MVMGGQFTSREGPSWLPALVKCEHFFSHCNSHTGGKNERNQFCFDCPEAGALCPEELARSHRGHASIQVRRASHRDVVRVAEVQKYVDLTNIQPYTINSARIVFLQSKPLPKLVKGAAHYCECCQRSIADPVRFCSIACKLQGVLEDRHDFTLTLTAFSKTTSPEPSTHSQSSDHFAPDTPTKGTKRGSSTSPFSRSKKSKLVFTPDLNLSVRLCRDDETKSNLSSLSPMAPPTPTYDSGPKVHHRKQNASGASTATMPCHTHSKQQGTIRKEQLLQQRYWFRKRMEGVKVALDVDKGQGDASKELVKFAGIKGVQVAE